MYKIKDKLAKFVKRNYNIEIVVVWGFLGLAGLVLFGWGMYYLIRQLVTTVSYLF